MCVCSDIIIMGIKCGFYFCDRSAGAKAAVLSADRTSGRKSDSFSKLGCVCAFPIHNIARSAFETFQNDVSAIPARKFRILEYEMIS